NGFGRLLEHGGTEWETVRHSCWHGCWHDNPSRQCRPAARCNPQTGVNVPSSSVPDGSHRHYAVGIWPQATAPDGLVVLPQRRVLLLARERLGLVASSFTLDRFRAGGESATDLASGFAMADSVTALDELRATTDYLQRRLRPNPSS